MVSKPMMHRPFFFSRAKAFFGGRLESTPLQDESFLEFVALGAAD
jgi:hypothetical protein